MSKVQSEACCTVPPVQAKDYKEKGKYIDVDGTKCYTTGPSNATSAILIIYDIFGFKPQTIQGADILASSPPSTSSTHQHQVFMPDLFNGNPLPTSVYPPKTDADKKTLSEFFAGPASPPDTVKKIHSLIASLKQSHPTIKKWGCLGMCWGGKIVSLTSAGPSTPWSAVAEVHPAMIDPADAKEISIPVCMLASGDEDRDAVKKFEETLTGEKHVEVFGDQVHGWMAARADLEDERVRGEYVRGYGVLLEWFHRFL